MNTVSAKALPLSRMYWHPGIRNVKFQVILCSKHALPFIFSYISFSDSNERDEGKFKISGKTERF